MSSLALYDVEEFVKSIKKLQEKVRKREIDPFSVEIKEILFLLRQFLQKYGYLVLQYDAEAINYLVEIISEQEEWVKAESEILGIGPLSALAKIKRLKLKAIVKIFVKCWHPLIFKDQLTLKEIERGLEHLEKRRILSKRLQEMVFELGYVDREKLKEMGLLSDERFREKLQSFALKLGRILEEKGEVDYWSIVVGKDFNETVENAILLAHLISQGHVYLEKDPVKGVIYVTLKPKKRESESFTITVNFEKWKKVKGV